MKTIRHLYARWLGIGQHFLEKRIDLATRAVRDLQEAGMDANKWKFKRSKLRARYYRRKDTIARLTGVS